MPPELPDCPPGTPERGGKRPDPSGGGTGRTLSQSIIDIEAGGKKKVVWSNWAEDRPNLHKVLDF